MKNKMLYKLGWIFIGISCLSWVSLIIIPFLSLSVAAKAASAAGAVILAEVLFWIGAILVGKEVIKKFKAYLNPKNWSKEKKTK